MATSPPAVEIETIKAAPSINDKPKANKPRKKRPNYAKLHAKALPLETFPLPAFVPQNPLSLVRIIGALFSHYFSKESSRPTDKYIGYFSYETRSVHVTDPKHVRALWEHGFFGKGTLSRSEPSWLNREAARRKAQAGGTSEEHTSERRQERRMFKLERARAEREAIEEQLRKEGKVVDLDGGKALSEDSAIGLSEQQTAVETPINPTPVGRLDTLQANEDDLEEEAPIINQEHLQLCLAEAFFLAYGLGALSISPSPQNHTSAATRSKPWTSTELLPLFAAHTSFPPASISDLRPDAEFLTSYVAYHHYRSLGWVVRPGSKFAADWLLYNRGPVFSHAEFSVVVVPEYPPDWEAEWGKGSKPESKKWWDFHCINRVQSQVRKTLVLCYVQVPLRADLVGGDIATILKSYKVRDIVVRRWLANRSRD